MFDAIPSLTTPTSFRETAGSFNKFPTSKTLKKMIDYMKRTTPNSDYYNRDKIFDGPAIFNDEMKVSDISDYYDVYSCLITNYDGGLKNKIGTVILPRKIDYPFNSLLIRFANVDMRIEILNSTENLNYIISNIGSYKSRYISFVGLLNSQYSRVQGTIKLGEYKGT